MKFVIFGLLAIVAIFLFLILIAIVKTIFTKQKHSNYMPNPDETEALRLAQKLSEMVKCNTTSYQDETNVSKYLEFHKVLEKLFPLVHQKLEKTVIDGNLLFYWKGKSNAKPIVLMSHQDVVPAEGNWIHEPFSGDIADGKVWGRGSVDTKCSLMALFEAVEQLLSQNYVPSNDVYLSSSCTEEWGGPGAPKLVSELERRNVKPFIVCDEGGSIITEPVGGIKGNFAMIGVYEKGKANIKFTAKSSGGHASAPEKNTPIARLSAFVSDMENHSYFKKKLSPEVSAMFNTLSDYAPFGLRLLLGNLWLFGPLVKIVLPKVSAQGAAMLKTTIAFTMQSGADVYNVIPQVATLGANMRFIPHQGEKESLQIVESVAKKYDLTMEIIESNDYTKAVDVAGEAYKTVVKAVQKAFPNLPYSPYVMTGATDVKNYQKICDNCIRFGPVVYGKEQLNGMHGINENIEYNCLPGAVDFYKNLIMFVE